MLGLAVSVVEGDGVIDGVMLGVGVLLTETDGVGVRENDGEGVEDGLGEGVLVDVGVTEGEGVGVGAVATLNEGELPV
jgi:hypothetical protein